MAFPSSTMGPFELSDDFQDAAMLASWNHSPPIMEGGYYVPNHGTIERQKERERGHQNKPLARAVPKTIGTAEKKKRGPG